ncbi:hypothetical protein EYF80_001834 [Liparis tanakae]|uniref:Uncharacterized protein n=1 Tax=Liparis tanakae TaxID=230148 RepID=A0A4Z2JCH7_9TELE|nr:hypothetical protein EYF80_001834 [Liparis tanakae]
MCGAKGFQTGIDGVGLGAAEQQEDRTLGTAGSDLSGERPLPRNIRGANCPPWRERLQDPACSLQVSWEQSDCASPVFVSLWII